MRVLATPQAGALSKSYDPVGQCHGRPGPAKRVLARTTTNQLMHYDGYPDGRTVVDNVSRCTSILRRIPIRRRCAARASTDRPPTARGRRPGRCAGAWPAGENCTFSGSPGAAASAAGARRTGWRPRADDRARLDQRSLVSVCGRPQPVRRGSLQGAEGPSESPRAGRKPGVSRSIGTGGDALFLKPGNRGGGTSRCPIRRFADVSPVTSI